MCVSIDLTVSELQERIQGPANMMEGSQPVALSQRTGHLGSPGCPFMQALCMDMLQHGGPRCDPNACKGHFISYMAHALHLPFRSGVFLAASSIIQVVVWSLLRAGQGHATHIYNR
jgi:hypothetical protein